MADEQEKTQVPSEVSDGFQKEKQDAANARGEYLRHMEAGKEIAAKYGEPDFPSLLRKVGSDSVFAQRLVEDLVTKSDTISVGILPDAPQEHNVTGKLDHTGDVATKLKTGASTPVAPPEPTTPSEPVSDGTAAGEKVN